MSMPGWPTNASSEFNEADIYGHNVVELSQSKFNVDVGGMRCFDYFEDGSFYVLLAPGVSLFLDPILQD